MWRHPRAIPIAHGAWTEPCDLSSSSMARFMASIAVCISKNLSRARSVLPRS